MNLDAFWWILPAALLELVALVDYRRRKPAPRLEWHPVEGLEPRWDLYDPTARYGAELSPPDRGWLCIDGELILGSALVRELARGQRTEQDT